MADAVSAAAGREIRAVHLDIDDYRGLAARRPWLAGAMGAVGVTMNMIAMFALIVVLGMIVDDAIVVVENVHRHIEQGGRFDLAAAGLDGVGPPVEVGNERVVAGRRVVVLHDLNGCRIQTGLVHSGRERVATSG